MSFQCPANGISHAVFDATATLFLALESFNNTSSVSLSTESLEGPLPKNVTQLTMHCYQMGHTVCH